MRSFRVHAPTTDNAMKGNDIPQWVANPTSEVSSASASKVIQYTGKEVSVSLGNFTQVFVSAVAGGGAGGVKTNILSTFYSGGGGGSGGSIYNLFSVIPKNSQLTLYVGKGGQSPGEDGEDTYVFLNGIKYALTGGKGAVGNVGGAGGNGTVEGRKGNDGNISLPSYPNLLGGAGGDSFFGFGGGSSNIISGKAASVPNFGAGGQGMSINSSIAGVGGTGLAMIRLSA